METTRKIKFDPVPRLRITKPIEQTLILLLSLYQLKQAQSFDQVADFAQAHQHWRGLPPDWDRTWQERCLKRQYVSQRREGYSLSAKGIAQLQDWCTLVFAARDSFRHLTSTGYLAACQIRTDINRRPFTNRVVSQQQPRKKKGHFYIYTILLHSDAIDAYPYLVDINPDRRTNHPCLYVGYTGWTPESRFQGHKNGRKASQVVMEYGVCLVPDLYAHLNPIHGREQAIEMERRFAIGLRTHGYTITAGHHDWG